MRHAQDVVEAMKAEGIYSHFSIYFPLWLTPPPGAEWLDGYNGSRASVCRFVLQSEVSGEVSPVVEGTAADAQ